MVLSRDGDPRPLPEAYLITGAIVAIFDALVVTLQDSRHEPDLETLLWGQVNCSIVPSIDRARARRQRAGAEARAARAGWLGGQVGRVGATAAEGMDL